MTKIEHPHQDSNCEICSLVDNVIRPIVEFDVRKKIALELEQRATDAMISNEYNANDTAIRSKTYYHAAQIVRGKSND